MGFYAATLQEPHAEPGLLIMSLALFPAFVMVVLMLATMSFKGLGIPANPGTLPTAPTTPILAISALPEFGGADCVPASS